MLKIFLKNAINSLTLTPREFANRADIDYNLFRKLLHGHATIDLDTAGKLAFMCGNNPQFWLNLDKNYVPVKRRNNHGKSGF